MIRGWRDLHRTNHNNKIKPKKRYASHFVDIPCPERVSCGINMTYGTSSLDLGKAVVALSCIFNGFMIFLIATDPIAVIHSEHGGGWWDILITAHATGQEDVGIYPRIWAYYLLFQAIVRLNWVFTVETAPSLYRCVLLSYVLPFVHLNLETYHFKTIPPIDLISIMFVTVGPWLAIAVGYKKYTAEPLSAKKNK